VLQALEELAAFDVVASLTSLETGEGPSLAAQVALLFAGRARELLFEAYTVEAIGKNDPSVLSRRRYRVDRDPEGPAALSLAERWLSEAASEAETDDTSNDVVSDDESDARSLISQIRALLTEHRATLSVQVSTTLVPHAATGRDTVWVARGRSLSPTDSRRIALHEVLAHALPRMSAETETSRLFLAATPLGADDEEGRALLVEQRHGLLDLRRRRELASRHLAAHLMFEGQSYHDVVQELVSRAVEPPLAIRHAARAFRGAFLGSGGLGREWLYLPAFLRVGEALSRQPELEAWLRRGRVGLDAARLFVEVGLSDLPELLPKPSDSILPGY
jgi:hypothetical protein